MVVQRIPANETQANSNFKNLSQFACSSGLSAELNFFIPIYETNLGRVYYSLKCLIKKAVCLSIFSYFIGKINPPQIKLDYDFVVKVNIKQGKFNKAHMTHEFPMNREVYLERSICETTQQSYLYLSGFRYMKSKEHYFALIMFSRQFSLQPYMCTKTSINVKFKLTWEIILLL